MGDRRPTSDPLGRGSATAAGRRWSRLVGAAIAAVLVVVVVAIADPRRLWRLLTSVHPGWLAAALLVSGANALALALRLVLLMPDRRLGVGRAVVVAAVSRAAALLLPARLGEAALPVMLQRLGGQRLTSGVAVLMVARVLDAASIAAWCGAGLLRMGGLESPIVLLGALLLAIAPILALPRALALADGATVRLVAPRGLSWRRWARRVRHVRRAVDDISRRRTRLLLGGMLSLALWGMVWLVAWLLLRSVGYPWPMPDVVVGSAVAALSAALPVNLVANLGTVEAGWTATFTALGFPVQDAAASGLAIHLLSLAISAVYGAAAWLVSPRMQRSAARGRSTSVS